MARKMRWVVSFGVLWMGLGLCARASAQDVVPGPPAEPVPPPPLDGAALEPVGDPGAEGASSTDAPEVEAAYGRAMDAYAAGRYEEAAALFDQVAERTSDPSRRAASEALAVQARQRRSQALAPPTLEAARAPAGYGSPSEGQGSLAGAGVPPAPADPAAEEPGGRSEGARAMLLTGSTMLGLSMYAWMLPTALGVEDDRAYVGTYLLISSASFFLPYVLTMDAPPTWGMSAMSLYGATTGLIHGALIYGLLDDSDFGDEDALAGSMALTSLIEGVAGYALAGYTEMSAGEAHGISTGNLAGMAAALEILAFLSPDDADARALSGFTLLGALAGSAGGKLLSDQRDWTWGDVEIIQTAILLGHFLGITGVVAVEPSSATSFVRATGLTLLLTGAAGLLVGDVLMDGFDATWWQGLAIELATLAGGFLGAGMLFVAGADDPKPIMIAGAVGGVAGFALSFLSMNIAREGASQAGAASAPIAIAPWFGAEGARGVSLGGSF